MTETKPDVTGQLAERPAELHLSVAHEDLPFFTTILQSGFEQTTPGGTTLAAFLGALPGFSPDYLGATVQTIFLNGTAVDDINVPLFASGDDKPLVVALSAAMPGLAGAIFRRNGPHGSLRSARLREGADGLAGRKVRVSVKLFNQIARVRGGQLLRQGVIMEAGAVRFFFARRPELLPRVVRAVCDGIVIEAASLAELALPVSRIRLVVAA